jgi:hypothetical protein
MPTHHLIRPDAETTFCGISKTLVASTFTTEERLEPQKHDLILDAVRRAGGMPHVCPDCLRFRVLPWTSTHGQTSEDELADNDEYWRAIEAARREKTVD